MAANDAGSRAGHVGEDGIEELAIPPLLAGSAIGAPDRRRRPSRRRLSSTARTTASSVERQQIDIGDFQQMPVLPPGAAQASRTRWPAVGRQDSAARWAPASWIETRPVGKARQGVDRHGTLEDQRSAANLPGRQTCALQACQ
jgi:hypothetical protein